VTAYNPTIQTDTILTRNKQIAMRKGEQRVGGTDLGKHKKPSQAEKNLMVLIYNQSWCGTGLKGFYSGKEIGEKGGLRLLTHERYNQKGLNHRLVSVYK